MKIKVLGSSSKENTYIFESDSSILIVEIGCRFSEIISALNFNKKIAGCIVSHGTADSKELLSHLDHSRSMFEAVLSGIDVYGKHNLEHNKQYTFGEWVVMPIKMPHGDTTSYNYIIYNTVEKKRIFFATDCEKLPKLSTEKQYDLMMLECNYSIETVQDNASTLSNKGFLGHLSKEVLTEWLERLENKPKVVLLIHLSNSGNIGKQGLEEHFKPFAERVWIAKKGLDIEV